MGPIVAGAAYGAAMSRQGVLGADGHRLQRSSALAGIGDGVVATALPLLAAGVTRDPLSVAAVIAAQHIAWAVVAMLGPALVSDADQRTVLGLATSLRAAAAAVIGILVMTGGEVLALLMAAALAVGFGEALTDGGEQATEPLLAGASGGSPPRSVLRRNGMIGLALVGMPLGGLVYELAAGLAFLVAMGLFALAALVALSLREQVVAGGRPNPGINPSGLPPLASGTATVTTAAGLSTAASSAVLGVLVLFALDDLGLGAPAFGLLLAGLAAAAAAGGFASPALGQLVGLRGGVFVALTAAAVGYIAAGLLGDPVNPIPAAAGLGLASFAGMVASVLLRALIHSAAGRVVEGPALSAFHARVWATIPAGALAGGLIARATDVSGALVAAGAASALGAVAALAIRSPALAGVARKMG